MGGYASLVHAVFIPKDEAAPIKENQVKTCFLWDLNISMTQ